MARILDDPRNELLRRLIDERPDLADHARLVELRAGAMVAPPWAEMDACWFPATGTIATVVALEDGFTTQVALAGAAEAAGLAAILPVATAGLGLVSIMDGVAYRVPSAALASVAREHAGVAWLVARELAWQDLVIAHGVACARRHQVRERVAHWLLDVVERAGVERLGTTEETMATLLGTQRPTVARSLAAIAGAGAIIHRRRSIEVRDLALLQALSCPCHDELAAASAWRADPGDETLRGAGPVSE